MNFIVVWYVPVVVKTPGEILYFYQRVSKISQPDAQTYMYSSLGLLYNMVSRIFISNNYTGRGALFDM